MEVHDRDELARAEQVGARLIGVNNRDLRDFSVDMRAHVAAAGGDARRDDGGVRVWDLQAQSNWSSWSVPGWRRVLVGESLMRAPEPEQALVALLEGSSVRP